jgi:ribosomal protein S18 acetylase RimI-like enzyme
VVTYIDSPKDITADQLRGFFVGRPDPPSCAAHLSLLKTSTYVVLAVDDVAQNVVGFVTAIADGVLTAHIPLLEVLPAYQGQGIGSELMQRMLNLLRDYYAVDLVCDPEIQPFYARLGMKPQSAMILRNYDRQSGG